MLGRDQRRNSTNWNTPNSLYTESFGLISSIHLIPHHNNEREREIKSQIEFRIHKKEWKVEKTCAP